MTTHSKPPRAFAPLAALVVLAACGDAPKPTAPAAEPRPATVSGYSLVITPTDPMVVAGTSVQLTAKLYGATGTPVSVAAYRWTSSDPAAATVNSAGLVSALVNSVVTITATPADGSVAAVGTTKVMVQAPSATCPTKKTPNLYQPSGATPSVTAKQNTPLIFQLAVKDGDLPCDAFAFEARELPSGGALYQVADDGTMTDVRITAGASLTNRKGLVAFVPDADVTGSPVGTFTYAIFDEVGRSGWGSTRIDVTRDAPVAVATMHAGVNVVPATNVTPTVANVASLSGLQICIDQLPRNGTLYVNDASVYANQVQLIGHCLSQVTSLYYVVPRMRALGCDVVAKSAYPQTDRFTWYATAGGVRSNSVTDDITITYQNTPPTYTGPSDVAAAEDRAVAIPLSASDLDGDKPTYRITSLPAHGKLTVDAATIATVPYDIPNAYLAGVVAYVPDPDFNTSAQTEEFRLRMRDATAERECDYTVHVRVDAVNDAPVVSGPASLSASVAADGAVTPAWTKDIRVADDASSGELLTVTLYARGPAARSVRLSDPRGLASVRQVSATEFRFVGTLAAINAALGSGVEWTPGAGGESSGELAVTVADQGQSWPLVGNTVIPVTVTTPAVVTVTGPASSAP